MAEVDGVGGLLAGLAAPEENLAELYKGETLTAVSVYLCAQRGWLSLCLLVFFRAFARRVRHTARTCVFTNTLRHASRKLHPWLSLATLRLKPRRARFLQGRLHKCRHLPLSNSD